MDMKALFNKGISFVKFVNQDEDIHKDKTLDIYNNIKMTENIIEAIKQINIDVNIIAFAEIWCPDCMINVPPLEKMCELNDKINLTILPREGNEEYLEEYKIAGKAKIPTFILLDKDFNKMGYFIEKPSIVKNVEDNGSQADIIVTKRKYRKGEYTEDTIKEIIKIINN